MNGRAAMPSGAVDAGLPMRLSARLNDEHFDKAAAGLSERINIYVDGELLEHATSYDVIAGEVVRHRRLPNGDLILERGAPTFETLRGRVEVRWVRGAAA